MDQERNPESVVHNKEIEDVNSNYYELWLTLVFSIELAPVHAYECHT